MSIKASKTAIGAFVLGAICLVVVGVVVFGSGKLFSQRQKLVMYFDGSVKGLSVGAPVVFRGVRIGSVVDIVLQGNLHNMTFSVPVIAEIDLNRFRLTNGAPQTVSYDGALIRHGLRAQLQSQSLVTGQLMIDLDFHPDKPARLIPDDTGYPQIPTIPSTADELARKLEELPLKQLLERTNSLVGGLERMVNSSDLQNVPRSLNMTLADTRTLLKKIDQEVGLLSADAHETIGAATATIKHADKVLEFREGPPAEAISNLNQTLVGAQHSLEKLDQTLDAVRSTVSDERSGYQLRQSLKEVGEAARRLGSLVEYLEQHPEALLRGKTNLKEN